MSNQHLRHEAREDIRKFSPEVVALSIQRHLNAHYCDDTLVKVLLTQLSITPIGCPCPLPPCSPVWLALDGSIRVAGIDTAIELLHQKLLDIGDKRYTANGHLLIMLITRMRWLLARRSEQQRERAAVNCFAE
jgi:hypothetical protein